MSVATYFKTFCERLLISQSKRSTIGKRYKAICTRLNKDFWEMDTDGGGRYVGSFGRNTANGLVSDIDMLFEMPWTTYNRYNRYTGNGQSALLQAVKNSIEKTYSGTYLKGDGQIVEVIFADNIDFEVLPAFKNGDDSYTFADSNRSGSWKITNPIPEIDAVATGDFLTNNNLRRLCRMARSWKYQWEVPIKGLLIDTFAYRFLMDWEYKDKSYMFYDWMSRDFFEYLKNQDSNQTNWYAVGSQQLIYNPANFRYKATRAFNIAKEAIRLEEAEREWSARQEWREIYGTRFPD